MNEWRELNLTHLGSNAELCDTVLHCLQGVSKLSIRILHTTATPFIAKPTYLTTPIQLHPPIYLSIQPRPLNHSAPPTLTDFSCMSV